MRNSWNDRPVCFLFHLQLSKVDMVSSRHHLAVAVVVTARSHKVVLMDSRQVEAVMEVTAMAKAQVLFAPVSWERATVGPLYS